MSEVQEAAAHQEPLVVGGEEAFPEFYTRCCADVSRVPAAAETRIDGMKAILTRASYMWENGRVITVGFVSPAPGDSVQQNKVKQVVKEWETYANLKFQFISVGTNANIRITFQPIGSWSYIGKGCLSPSIPKTDPTMNFGWVYSTPTIGEEERGTILHEFGHAIGYLHEHQSPRRGEKITLNEPVVIEYYRRTQRPPWDAAKTRQNVINVYNVQEVTNFSSVDTTSIMMYFMPAQFNTQGLEIKPNRKLSDLDKAFAFLNYPFVNGLSSVDPSVNLVNSLNTVGITGSYRTSITSEYAENDWQGVRAEFTRWAVNQKALADKAHAAAEREEAANTANVVALEED